MALFPLVLLIVGLNEASNVIMVALGPLFTMLIGSAAAVQNVDPIYLKVARSFNVGTRDLYLKVALPAALPIIFSAFRVSLGLGLLGVVAVEFLMTNNGLGYLICHSGNQWLAWSQRRDRLHPVLDPRSDPVPRASLDTSGVASDLQPLGALRKA